MTRRGCAGGADFPDMEITKKHILAAGRELMLAADGALRFCKAYAESASSPSSRSQLTSFFTKAIAVADELGKGLVCATSATNAAKKAASPLIDALGREMAREYKTCRKTSSKKARSGKKTAGARKTVRKKKAARKTTTVKKTRKSRPGSA